MWHIDLVSFRRCAQVLFVLLIIVVALLLFSLLVANMQTFLGSLSDRMEDYRTQVRARARSLFARELFLFARFCFRTLLLRPV